MLTWLQCGIVWSSGRNPASESNVAALRATTRCAPLLVLISPPMPSEFVIFSWLADIDAAPSVHKSPSEGSTLPKHMRSAVGAEAEAEAAFRKKQYTLAPAATKVDTSHWEPYPRIPRESQLLRDGPIIMAAAVEGEVEAYSASYQPDALTIGNRTDALANSGYHPSTLSSPMSSSPDMQHQSSSGLDPRLTRNRQEIQAWKRLYVI